MATETLNFSDFTRIEVGMAIEVEIIQASTYSVNLDVQNFEIKNVMVSKEGDTLKIGRKITPRSIILAPLAKIRVSINMPALLEVTLSGASHGAVMGFSSTHDFALKLRGASHLDLANMSTNTMKVDLSGASHLTGKITASGNSEFHLSGASHLKLDGSTMDIVIDASGASHVELYDFVSWNASVRLSGASHGDINLAGTLDAKLSGAAKLNYVGNPTMGNISVTGASSFTKA
jgi:hypothetical protein